MPNQSLDHSRILNEHMRENSFWHGLTDAMDAVINPCIQAPVETLQHIRDPGVEPRYAYLNTRMLGFNISSLSFTTAEYRVLLRNLGKYWLTRGASNNFINFISFVKNVELIYIPLWANSLDMPINNLVSKTDAEIPLWQGGPWFPTTFYDIYYSKVDYPTLDETLFRNFIYQLSPEHLVLRQLIGIESATSQLYLTAIPLDRQYYTAIATQSS